jgi:hypothetical protein
MTTALTSRDVLRHTPGAVPGAHGPRGATRDTNRTRSGGGDRGEDIVQSAPRIVMDDGPIGPAAIFPKPACRVRRRAQGPRGRE